MTMNHSTNAAIIDIKSSSCMQRVPAPGASANQLWGGAGEERSRLHVLCTFKWNFPLVVLLLYMNRGAANRH